MLLFFPFIYSTLITASTGLDFDWLGTSAGSTTMLTVGAVVIYALRKLDTISDILSYLLGSLVVCIFILTLPVFSGTQAALAAEEILGLMVEFMRAFVELIKSWTGASLPILLGGI